MTLGKRWVSWLSITQANDIGASSPADGLPGERLARRRRMVAELTPCGPCRCKPSLDKP
jgi:hypothetical protein